MYWPCGVPQVHGLHVKFESDQSVREETPRITNPDGRDDGTASTSENSVASESPAVDVPDFPLSNEVVLDLRLTRSELYLATLTHRSIQLWSTRPTAVLAAYTRSDHSLKIYGQSLEILFRPDGGILVLRTSLGYLITFTVEHDLSARVLQQHTNHTQTRKQSILRTFGASDSYGLGEVLIRFRRAIKIDAGIHAVLALDQELIVATVKPAAVQCIRWDSPKSSPQASAQLLSKMEWMEQKTSIMSMTHDRAMNLSIWVGDDGTAYAVRKIRPQTLKEEPSNDSLRSSASSAAQHIKLFDGYCFHRAATANDKAVVVAVNARFSLIAVATVTGKIMCYAAKDYAGNIPLSHTFNSPASATSTGRVNCLAWSPDGYCLFAGYEHGWGTWSVFGKEGASSFTSNHSHSVANSEEWLMNVKGAVWASNGAEIMISCEHSSQIFKLEFSRSAAVGCFSCANLVRALQQTPTTLAIYRGHELPDLISISNEPSLWHHAQYPVSYLHNQWPIRMSVVSQDGRYIAIAGKRGLAHYSVSSGRWKVFYDINVENSFTVRGGMCWFSHILAVATEHAGGFDLRLYSRDQDLGRTPLHIENLNMPIAFIGPSGEDSLLVYTYENTLYHFIINITTRGAQLMQVGQIAFHGLIRAPSRVRSVSWILPDHQLRNGDPSRDVEHASIVFLVDDKLVSLQPSNQSSEEGVRYDMKVIAHHVEYYILMRDQIYFNFNEPLGESVPATPSPGEVLGSVRSQAHYSLRDSLWIFTGANLCMWPDVRHVLNPIAGEMFLKRPLLSIPVDFYPLSILLNKGVVLGMESELLQRRDLTFAMFRSLIRTQLFLPYVLRHQLLEAYDTSTAFALANQYQNLSYFPHALEILLHIVLDSEADRRKNKNSTSSQPEPLPAVLSFLQMALTPTSYLSTIVQCVRKTEFSYWRYLFAHLPSPEAMFEEALGYNDLKTASGYMIIMQTLEEEEDDEDMYVASTQRFEEQAARLMGLAKDQNDFELCSELARFMIGIDPRGDALRRVVQRVGFAPSTSQSEPKVTTRTQPLGLKIPHQTNETVKLEGKPITRLTRLLAEEPRSAGAESESMMSRSSGGDYFSTSPGDISAE